MMISLLGSDLICCNILRTTGSWPNGIDSMGLWGIFWLVWFLQVSTVYIFKKIKITITSMLLQRDPDVSIKDWSFWSWKSFGMEQLLGRHYTEHASNSRARRHRNCVWWLEKSFWPQFEVADTLDFIAGNFQRLFLTVCIKCIQCCPFVVIIF